MSKIPSHFADRELAIFGLGYVGLTLAVAMAETGFRVHAVEINPAVIDSVSRGKAHFSEYGLDARLAAQVAKGAITVSDDPTTAKDANAFIVTVGTPIDGDKRTKFGALENVLGQIANVMRDGSLVILRSTVRVGTTEEVAKPVLAASGKSFDLAFCPERTLEGKALSELVSLPQIVGGVDAHATFRAAQLFSLITPTIIRVGNAATAEMVKLVNNTQRDLLFAFANEIAGACDALGISAHEVITSGNVGYPRSTMPLPGPVGGPCLEKDPYILAEGLERFEYAPKIALTARTLNEELPDRSARQMLEEFAGAGDVPKRIAILGLAFKGRPETDDLRGTMALPLIAALRAHMPDAAIVGWDPVVKPDVARRELRIDIAETAGEAVRDAALVILQTNHPALEGLDLAALAGTMASPGLIYDFWNQHGQMDSFQLRPSIRYAALGGFNHKPFLEG